MTDPKQIADLADAVRREGEQKQYEARVSARQGEAWIAQELNRRAVALIAAAGILERISCLTGKPK
jgi:hypothetical protein